ncbi:unnamed protein product, partial [Dibothriocephalus latus]
MDAFPTRTTQDLARHPSSRHGPSVFNPYRQSFPALLPLIVMRGEKADALKCELLRARIQLEKSQMEVSDLKLEVETVRNSQGLAERQLAELQRLFDEQVASVSQLATVEERKSELELENASLRTRLEQALHGPGNSSSLISRPDGSGLMRSSSLLHTTRLEQRVTALESENAELRRKQA